MKIIIDIQKELYTNILATWKDIHPQMHSILKNGTPLPKGHGRLIDADWIEDNCPYYYSDEDATLCYAIRDIDKAPTIIEKDI